VLCLWPLNANSFEMNGRVSADFYAYQGSTEEHARPYLRFWGNAIAWRSSGGRFVRLHTSLRWTDDFVDPLPWDPELFVFDAYVQFQGLIPRTGLYAGRQFVYTGVGSALMDGGRIRIRPFKYLDLDAFGGSRVSSEDPETIQSISDHLVVGARLGAYRGRSTRAGLSWMLMRRGSQPSFHRVGLDADKAIGRADVYGRVAYNVVDHRLAEVNLRAAYKPAAWYLSGEYHRREPSVAYNSIFTLIDFFQYEIVRAEVRRRVWRQLSLAANVHADVADQDDLPWRIGVGIHAPAYSLMWIHQTGYAGENDGVSGYFTQALNTKWSVFATANLFRYRVQLEQMERSDSYATTAGLRWRPGWGLTIHAEGQYLKNAVYKDDTRFLFRIAKDFSVRPKRGEGER
jgi:hypothetical protein